MQAAGRNPELHYYEAAHGFFNATRPVYVAACAELAWARLLDFLGRHL